MMREELTFVVFLHIVYCFVVLDADIVVGDEGLLVPRVSTVGDAESGTEQEHKNEYFHI